MSRSSKMLLLLAAAILLVTISSLAGSASGDPLPDSARPTSAATTTRGAKPVNPADDEAFMRNVTDQVQDLVNKLGQPSVLAFLPEAVKIRLARQQKEKYDQQISLFISLPRNVQERILVQILARNESAAKIVTDNQDVLKELGFNFDFQVIVARASEARKRLQQK